MNGVAEGQHNPGHKGKEVHAPSAPPGPEFISAWVVPGTSDMSTNQCEDHGETPSKVQSTFKLTPGDESGLDRRSGGSQNNDRHPELSHHFEARDASEMTAEPATTGRPSPSGAGIYSSSKQGAGGGLQSAILNFLLS